MRIKEKLVTILGGFLTKRGWMPDESYEDAENEIEKAIGSIDSEDFTPTFKLKPCPFCGHTSQGVIRDLYTDNVYSDYIIDCDDCGLRMYNVFEGDLIRKWNSRE